jgi:hypothetical protein
MNLQAETPPATTVLTSAFRREVSFCQSDIRFHDGRRVRRICSTSRVEN